MRDQFRRSPVSRPAVPAPSMNTDKQNNGAPAKPFTPTLSAAFRTANKNSHPLTPRLAGAGGHQTPKKISHTDTASPLPHRDDGPTYLSANITPRSGSRNSRRDGALSSPENTPTGAQQVSQTSRPTLPLAAGGYHRTERSPVRGSGKPEPARPTRAKSVTGDNLTPRVASRPNSSCESSGGSPMFFHADDARSSVSSYETETRPRSYIKSSQGSTFLYADGTRDDESQDNLSRTPSTNKRRSTGSSRAPAAATNHPDVLPRLKSSQLSEPESRPSADSTLQPSPNIDDVTESKSRQSSPAPNLAEQVARPSCPIGQQLSHRKSCSLDSTPNVASPRGGGRRASPIISSSFLPPEVLNGGQTPNLSPRVVSNNSSDPAEPHGSSFPLAQSPIKIEGPTSHTDEQAVNARTARKILDLEISNSSLLAINRTLERELRKQNAELRRYRRLSRAGRLSIDPLSPFYLWRWIVYGHDNESSAEGEDGTGSPNSSADRDTRVRASDEKRFLLDLAKHQELLADSQKMNQSLKRCLGWTEELIREGKKALEYHVHVNDVEIGGRVLAPDEVGEEVTSGRALLSPAAEIQEALEAENSELLHQ
ncbi:hypothetical protein T310_2474 [Rasamsonia emersonii CBS 393.64]|uniref:Uncharacterized protein n=1 Tax=Rasamsonia emersonii (strain ATCC 16479 / CBS 393.64 / IMI 116815) TaxID=1408163 RepID=A0A0F4YZG3_RASE3|nr:hypothetical protein T310_2474 [Rasamsonia emersonii CBS 393.64]KKA23505.1 hypothetical protein T310_2474 [Rasamsonia emersonii CBS 393.64]